MDNFQKNFITRPRVSSRGTSAEAVDGLVAARPRVSSRGTALGARDGPVVASDKKLIRCSLVHEKQIMDEIVLLHRSTGNYYALNQTGTIIWNYCKEGKKVEEILDFISGEYPVEKKEIEKDIRLYIQELLQEGILEIW